MSPPLSNRRELERCQELVNAADDDRVENVAGAGLRARRVSELLSDESQRGDDELA